MTERVAEPLTAEEEAELRRVVAPDGSEGRRPQQRANYHDVRRLLATLDAERAAAQADTPSPEQFAELDRLVTESKDEMAAQADTWPTPHDRLSAFIEGTFLEPEERDKLRAALESLSAGGGLREALAKLPPGPYEVRWPAEQGGAFTLWGRQGTPPDFADGWAIPLVASGVDTAIFALRDILAALAAPSRDAGLPSVRELALALHQTAIRNHNLGEGPQRAICLTAASHEARATAILAALAADGAPFPAGVNRADSEGEG